MKTPKFKVGDKVKVLRASTKSEYDLWMDSWINAMNCAIGKVMTINYVNLNNLTCYSNLYPKYKFEEVPSNFPEFVLENEIQVGQQLLFSFMVQ